MHIAHATSWESGFLLSGLALLTMLKYAIWPRKNTPKASLCLKFLWGLSFTLSLLVMVSSLIDGTGLYTEYNIFIARIFLPILLLLLITIIIGGYQKAMSPKVNVFDRRFMLILLSLMVLSIIILICILGPFTYSKYY